MLLAMKTLNVIGTSSVRLLTQLNSCVLLVKLSVVQSFNCTCNSFRGTSDVGDSRCGNSDKV